MTEEKKEAQVTSAAKDPQKEERMWGMLCHLTGLCGFIGIPLGNILGPLVIWLIKKNEVNGVDAQGKEALNFQISMTIYASVAFLLCFVFIGFLLIFPLILADIILTIIAAVKVNNGEKYEYPFTIKFLK